VGGGLAVALDDLRCARSCRWPPFRAAISDAYLACTTMVDAEYDARIAAEPRMSGRGWGRRAGL